MMGWGAWQWPAGALAWCALACGLLAFLAAQRSWRAPKRAWIAIGLMAAAASAAYVPLVLRGGPRIIDSTAYWLQSRLFAAGHVALATKGPASSYRGRFLLETEPGSFAGIFPPGYPSVLGVFQLLHAPWVLGPLLALMLAVLTAKLAAALVPPAARDRAMLVAAGLSLASGAVRYHTAEPMAHGLVMVAGTGAILCMLHRSPRAWLGAGACFGIVLSSRFASAIALVPVLGWLAVRGHERPWRRLIWLAVGTAPFVVALGLYQRAVTGSAWVSPQALYYLRSDAPAGCFRYGFGAGIGCDFEHREFVQAHLPSHVYGAWEALLTTLRRLRLHALDIANFEPVVVLVALGAVKVVRERGAQAWWVVYPLLVALAYAPFYFDGNYPGGGARFFTDALPLEHALLAVCVVSSARQGFALLGVAFFGFALHAAPEHQKLRARDGGTPMWSEAAEHTERRLVFTNTDHGFALGTDPRAKPAHVIARLRGDSNDLLLVERLGLARLAFFDVERGFTFSDYLPERGTGWRFEGEHEWPARGVHAATAIPIAAPAPCAVGRALAIAGNAADAAVTTSLYMAASGTYRVRVIAQSDTPLPIRVTLGGRTASFVVRPGTCDRMDLGAFDLVTGDQDVEWVVGKGEFAFDAMEVGGVSP
jgi:hypothetical protein